MKVTVVTNQKGGTGKTTVAVNLAATLAADHGLRVLLVDMDYQSHVARSLGVPAEGRGLLDVLLGDRQLAELVQPTGVPGLDIVASTRQLLRLERELAGEVGAELCLRDALASLPSDRWDLVVVDTNPTLGLPVICTLVAADEVLIPVELQILPVDGLREFNQTLSRVRQRLNPRVRLLGFVSTRAQPRTSLHREMYGRLDQVFPGLVFETVIRENIRVGEAPSFAQPIVQYAPRSAGAQDFRALTREVIERWRSLGEELPCAA